MYILYKDHTYMSIAYGVASNRKLLLCDILSMSPELHRCYHYLFFTQNRNQKTMSMDLINLLNAVVANEDLLYLEDPLRFNYDQADSADRLSMQALEVLKPLYKHVIFTDGGIPDLLPIPMIIYVSFEQYLLHADDLMIDVSDRVERQNLIVEWKMRLSTIRTKFKNPSVKMQIYSDLFSGAAIQNMRADNKRFKKYAYERGLISIESRDTLILEEKINTVRTAIEEKIHHHYSVKMSLKEREIQKLLCLLLNKVPTDAVRAYYLKMDSDSNWRFNKELTIPTTVPTWLFDDNELSEILSILNHTQGKNMEEIAKSLLSEDDGNMSLPELPFLSAVQWYGNKAISALKKRINEMKRLISKLQGKEINKGIVKRTSSSLSPIKMENIGQVPIFQVHDYVLVWMKEGYYLHSKIIGYEQALDIYIVNLNEAVPNNNYIKKGGAIERYGPWFDKEWLMDISTNTLKGNIIADRGSRGSTDTVDIFNILVQINEENSFDRMPRNTAATRDSGVTDEEHMSTIMKRDNYEIIRKNKEWRFKYFPPQWLPGTIFKEGSNIATRFGGNVLILKRSNITLTGKVHYTHYDILIYPNKKTSISVELKNEEFLRRAVSILHEHLNDAVTFPTKEGVNIMRENAKIRLSDLRFQRKEVVKTFEWAARENERLDTLRAAKDFFASISSKINSLDVDASLKEMANQIETPLVENFDFTKDSYWVQLMTSLLIIEKRWLNANLQENILLARKARKIFSNELEADSERFYYALKEDRELSGDAIALVREQENLRMELLNVNNRLAAEQGSHFNLARVELENSLLLRSEYEKSFSATVFSEHASMSVIENKLYNQIPTLDYENKSRPQHIRRNGITLFKENDGDEMSVHVLSTENSSSPGYWYNEISKSPQLFEKPTSSDLSIDSNMYLLSILRYLKFYELFIRDKSQLNSSLPSAYIVKKQTELKTFFKYVLELAFAMYTKISRNIEPCEFASARELYALLKDLEINADDLGDESAPGRAEAKEGDSEEESEEESWIHRGHNITILDNYLENITVSSVEHIMKTSSDLPYSIIVSNNLHECLRAYIKFKHNTPQVGIFHKDVVIQCRICDSMSSSRAALCSALWRINQEYAFGMKMYDRGFAITSDAGETVRKSLINTLSMRYKKSIDVSFRSFRTQMYPERPFLNIREETVRQRGTLFQSTLKKYVAESDEVTQYKDTWTVREYLQKKLGVFCLERQLLFAQGIAGVEPFETMIQSWN